MDGHSVTLIALSGGYWHLRCSCGWNSKGSWHSVEGADAAARMHESGRDVEAWVAS